MRRKEATLQVAVDEGAGGVVGLEKNTEAQR